MANQHILRPLCINTTICTNTIYFFPGEQLPLECILPTLKDRNCFQQLKGAVKYKELLLSVRGRWEITNPWF